MKRFFVTILCFVYVAASSGTTINFHYCMGKFIGWDVAVAAPATCSNCGMHKEQKKNCCNDKHATLQLKKDQLLSNINCVPDCPIAYTLNHYSLLTKANLFDEDDITNPINGPPLQCVSLFILNSTFRI